jgi:hypothetical protein
MQLFPILSDRNFEADDLDDLLRQMKVTEAEFFQLSRRPTNAKDPYHFGDRDLSSEPAVTDYSLHLQPWNTLWNLSCGICGDASETVR